MARKFNNGRLGEQLMNNDLFNAYNRIKYIGNGLNKPVQQYQTPILDYSLWVDRSKSSDVMMVYDGQNWNPLFDRYYHPASVTVQPMNPVDGQLYIDQNGVIRYYEDKQWKVASAATSSEFNDVVAGTGNFLILPDMMKESSPQGTTYTVPIYNVGKLFDNREYIPREKFSGSGMKILYPKDGSSPKEKASWVHVNPYFLYGATKRLIKVLDKEDYFINVTSANTEFYGFKLGSPVGTLLRYIENFDEVDPNSDYRPVSGGIQLMNTGCTYDFIYAITYKFDSIDVKPGKLIVNNVVIGDNNEIFVGQISGHLLVFLSGTYLEQNQYSYNNDQGMLTLNTTDTITNDMDIVVAAFADIIKDASQINLPESQRSPFPFRITASNINANGDIVYQHEYIKQAARFSHPIVFVQGVATLYNPDWGITDEVEIDTYTGTITVYNFGPMPSDSNDLEIFIADIGAAALSGGTISNDYRIYDDSITPSKTYMVFINGICLGPSDLDVFDGFIEILGTSSVSGTDNKYVLMSMDEGDEGIDIMFDSSISYFTAQIKDNNESAVYNDCNMVVSYAYKDGLNGVLIDLNHIEKPPTNEEAYSTGEILKTRDEDLSGGTVFEYKIYNVHGDYQWTEYEKEYGYDELNKMSSMITQFDGNGSISIMSNDTLKGANLEFYAYTYSDEVDEHTLYGIKNCKMAFEGHLEDAGLRETQEFIVGRTQYYSPPNKGILGVYVNGVQVASKDLTSEQGKFSIGTPIGTNFKKDWGSDEESPRDLYDLLKNITDETSLAELQTMKNGEYADELADFVLSAEFLEKLRSLGNAIRQAETDNELFYYIERIEAGETYSVNRDWLTHGNRYTTFDNTYVAPTYFGPGSIDVYVNGVMLDRSSYSLFNNNNVMLNDLAIAGGTDEYDTEKEETHRLIKYYIEEYDNKTGQTTGELKRLYCESADEVLVEYRPDTSLRKTSYEIKDITYDMNGVLPYDHYEFPNSLLNTKDEIKIWIDGILYTGGYYIDGKDIILENSPLKMDPIKEYFNSHPDTYKLWKAENGEYSYRKSRIIFEWR